MQKNRSVHNTKALITGSLIMIAVPLLPLIIMAGIFFLSNKTTRTVTEVFPSPDNTYIVYSVSVENSSSDDETAVEAVYSSAAEGLSAGDPAPSGASTLLTGYASYSYSVVYQNDSDFTVYVTETNGTRAVSYYFSEGSFVKYNESVTE